MKDHVNIVHWLTYNDMRKADYIGNHTLAVAVEDTLTPAGLTIYGE